MANSRAATQRRREALSWVASHLAVAEFTTHDVLAQGDLLRAAVWPPYLKQAWKRVGKSADAVGAFLSRHPDFEKSDGVEERWAHGVRMRSQRWRFRSK